MILHVQLNIGKKVKTFVDKNRALGYYQVEENVEKNYTGMYFYKPQKGDYTETWKILSLK